MTNTLNTPIETFEKQCPVRVEQYGLRPTMDHMAKHGGGRGLVRSLTFLSPASLTLITERRRLGAWGILGGESGRVGQNWLNGEAIPGKCSLTVEAGDTLTIETPDGGSCGE